MVSYDTSHISLAGDVREIVGVRNGTTIRTCDAAGICSIVSVVLDDSPVHTVIDGTTVFTRDAADFFRIRRCHLSLIGAVLYCTLVITRDTAAIASRDNRSLGGAAAYRTVEIKCSYRGTIIFSIDIRVHGEVLYCGRCTHITEQGIVY